ncbi:hypothetical protein NIIDMKKI_39790 [Mycobacterium kansasii]|uniref:Uncharacterized protein n=1 Tax=Mycobacterium kansasii TaxID=1768 RepID=A0A7G1IF11_MYCKA|nr:hypothetical protein NIIDMKKI_39790 [Mycobacterium kansasii]
MMRFDVDVAGGTHRQVEAGVTAQRRQHVVVERHPGVDVDLPGAVEIQFDDDVGFARAPFDAGTAGCVAWWGRSWRSYGAGGGDQFGGSDSRARP